MALQNEQNEESEEVPAGHERQPSFDDAESENMEPPAHPVPSMQSAFEESIADSIEENDIPGSPVEPDAQARRHHLLESNQYDESWTARWKQKPTAQHHPLLKLMAQIVFGMHLLQQQQARSEKEVVKILQTHVNEVDTFLERTSEDYELAIRDIEDRIKYLKLPMIHMEVFETMLDDKKFRTQLLQGNEKIEKIIERTTKAMRASLLDVDKGAQANKELALYMKSVQDQWPLEPRGISDVFAAMCGNEQGWRKYLRELQMKANSLGRVLAQLDRLIGELSRMAAAASRRNKIQSQTITSEGTPEASAAGPRSKFSQEPPAQSPPTSPPQSHKSRRTSDLNKPLPKEPQAVAGAAPPVTPIPHPVPFAERYERPRQSPPDPSTPPRTSAVSSTPPRTSALSSAPPRPSAVSSISPSRPRTAGGTLKEARPADARVNPSEVLSFLQRQDPLGSHPPEESALSESMEVPRKLTRSQSHATNLMVSAVAINHERPKTARSRSQGAINILHMPPGDKFNSTNVLSKASLDQARALPSSKAQKHAVKSAAVDAEKRANMQSTGFARRISKRMKHLPPSTPEVEEPLPPDSAYSSGNSSGRGKFSPPNGLAQDAAEENRESVLGPLPFGNQGPGQQQQQHSESWPLSNGNAAAAASVKSLASSKSRSLSIRNALRTKWRKEKMVTA